MTWQPIETAPKDGTPVIVAIFTQTYGKIHYFWAPFTAHFEDERWRYSSDYGVEKVEAELTHWYPLPDPPEAIQ